MYQAECYVRISGTVYRKGETIDVAIDDKKAKRLLELGAITILHDSAPVFAGALDAKEEALDAKEEALDTDSTDDVIEIDAMEGIVSDTPKKKRRTSK